MKRNATILTLFALFAGLFSFAPTQAMAKRKTCTLKIKITNKRGKKHYSQRGLYIYKIKVQRKGGTIFGRSTCFNSKNGSAVELNKTRTFTCTPKIRKSKSCNSKWKIKIAWTWHDKQRNVRANPNSPWKQPSNGTFSYTFD